MATNALGTGTVNLPINIPMDERLAIGKAAFKHGAKSVGEYVRKLIMLGLEADDKLTAREVKEIRRKYYGMAHAVCGVGIILFLAFFCDDDTARRSRRVRSSKGRVEEVAA